MNTNAKSNRKSRGQALIFFSVTLLATLFLSSCERKEASSAQNPAKKTAIRIGWQTTWATQGQLALILKNTSALGQVGLEGDLKSFTYGAPLSEAALAGQLDVAFVGDQPAVNLLSRSTDWKIVARLMDFRVAIVVPTDSDVKTIADLKGKTLGIPFGASTHRFALETLKASGLNPAKDVNILNIDIVEQGDIVRSGGGKAWPKVDAFATWDHQIALYEQQKLARILKSGRAIGLVMMSQKYMDAHPQAAAAFLASFNMAYYYYATHQDQADTWFAAATGGKLTPSLLKKVAEIEPNLRAISVSQIDTTIGSDQLNILQQAADFAYANKLINSQLKIQQSVVTNLWPKVRTIIESQPTSQLVITSP
jgi:ABC-type nitrate/sulfonate/bicarbonate transport system substrate-binding protein